MIRLVSRAAPALVAATFARLSQLAAGFANFACRLAGKPLKTPP